MYNIYFIRLRILPRNLVHYAGVWMTFKGGGGKFSGNSALSLFAQLHDVTVLSVTQQFMCSCYMFLIHIVELISDEKKVNLRMRDGLAIGGIEFLFQKKSFVLSYTYIRSSCVEI